VHTLPLSQKGDNKKTKTERKALLEEEQQQIALAADLGRPETELPEQLKRWREGPYRVGSKWLVPPCGSAWQLSVREFLFDGKQGYLSMLSQTVHTKDGAVTIVSTDQWWKGDKNFQNNPMTMKPRVAKVFQPNLREVVIRPVMRHEGLQKKFALLDRGNIVN